MFKHNIKIAFRNLRKYKTQNIISVIGLALGFVCFTFGWHWLRWETNFDSFFPNATNICVVALTDEDNATIYARYQTVVQFVSQIPEIQQTSWARTGFLSYFQHDDRNFSMNFSIVDSSFVNLFQFEYIRGNAAHFKQLPNGVLLTQSAAIRLFGDEDPVGKQVEQIIDQLWGRMPVIHHYTVTGVIRDLPKHTNFDFDLLIHAEKMPSEDEYGTMFCLLYRATYLKNINKRFSNISDETGQKQRISLIPLNEMRPLFKTYKMKYSLPYVRIFVFASMFAFLGAVLNFVSFIFSKTVNRHNEFRLRLALGSNNTQLTLLLALETLLSVFIALFLSVILIRFFERPFEILSGANIYGIYRYAAFSALSCIAFICLLYIVFRNSPAPRYRVSQQIQRLMSVGQITIAFMFMTVAVIVWMQIKYLTSKDMGIDIDDIAYMHLGALPSRVADPNTVKSQLSALSGVSDVLVFPGRLIGSPGSVQTRISQKGQSETAIWQMSYISDDRFFDFFNVKLKEGRFFNRHDFRKCVINETAAKMLGTDPVGMFLTTIMRFDLEVVGVVHDIFGGSAREVVEPMIYVWAVSHLEIGEEPKIYYLPDGNRYYMKIAPALRTVALEQIQQIMEEHHADESSKCIFLEDQLAEMFRSETLTIRLFAVLTASNLLISIFGIYTMVSLATRRRRKEIAIRKVAGADATDIVFMFLYGYMRLVVIAGIVALPVTSLMMNKWLQGYAYRVDVQWWWLTVLLFAVALIVLATVLKQVLKAANEAPAEVVKSE